VVVPASARWGALLRKRQQLHLLRMRLQGPAG
jgi:hypothetical protein